LVQSSCSLRVFGPFQVEHEMVDGVAPRLLMGFPVRLPTPVGIVGCGNGTERPPCQSVARRWVALKDASRRFCDGLRPSLTAARRLAPRTAGRDGGMVFSIKHRDRRTGEHQFPCASRCLHKRLGAGSPGRLRLISPSCLGSAKRYVTDRSGAGVQCEVQSPVEPVDTRDAARTEERHRTSG
jgi:hypothetical protein